VTRKQKGPRHTRGPLQIDTTQVYHLSEARAPVTETLITFDYTRKSSIKQGLGEKMNSENESADNFTPTTESNVGHAAQSDNLAEGLTQQIDLAHQVNVDEDCGKYWSGLFNARGEWSARPIRCGHCDECLQRKADQTERRVLRRLEIRKDGNDSLVISVLSVPAVKVMALQKRIQRDETAQYYRAFNEAGAFDFIIQSDEVYGEVVETPKYDFALAAKISKEKGKRQTGLLYSLKSKKIAAEKEDTYSLNLTKITAEKPGDSKRITIIAKTIKPNKYAFDQKEHQARIFSLTSRLTGALDEAGIGYQTEGLIRQTRPIDRLKYNANVVECPNKTPIETDLSIGALSGQDSLFNEPEPEPGPVFYHFEVSEQECIERQMNFCWNN